MRPRPERLESLPQQYFAGLLARVAAAQAQDGEPVVDLGRGNPDIGPPPHVVERLYEVALQPTALVHGYAPFLGIPELKEAIAARYAELYGVELDPATEVAVIAGTKTTLIEFALATVERGETILLPDPGYPDYTSAPALAGARELRVPLVPEEGWAPDLERAPRANVGALYLNYPSNPCAACVPDGTFEAAIDFAEQTGAAVMHDFAYGDLVYDGRRPRSFLATPGAREVGIELFSFSKTYGMAGWRLGFALGNAEIVARLNLLNDHVRAGIFRAMQEAGLAALTGPQDSVEARRALYEARRNRVFEALAGTRASDVQCEGTFFVWFRLPEDITADQVLAEQRVALAPGEGFGATGKGWARISLATLDEPLDLGLARLADAFA